MSFLERYKRIFEKNRSVVIVWFASLFFIIIAGHAPVPSNKILIEFSTYLTVSYICVVLITLSVFAIRILLKIMLKERFGAIIISFIDICIKTAVLLQLVKAFVGGIGDTIFDYYKEDPLQFLLTSISVFIVCVAGLIAIVNRARVKQDAPPKVLQETIPISNLALRFTAAHEAGHAMLYSLIKPMPDYAEVKINKIHGGTAIEYSGLLGYTMRVVQDPMVTTKNFAEWEMLSFLAGQMGEEVLLGEQSLGSTADYEKWHILIRQYLGNQSETIYYVKPDSEFEFKHNLKIQKKTLERQRALLETFFIQNKSVLEALFAFLLENDYADISTLTNMFLDIHYTPDLPILSNA